MTGHSCEWDQFYPGAYRHRRFGPSAELCTLACAQKNHLSGLKRRLLRLTFWNETAMAEVRRDCQGLVRRNRYKRSAGTAAYETAGGERGTKERIQVWCYKGVSSLLT